MNRLFVMVIYYLLVINSKSAVSVIFSTHTKHIVCNALFDRYVTGFLHTINSSTRHWKTGRLPSSDDELNVQVLHLLLDHHAGINVLDQRVGDDILTMLM